jgi:hypothetical protein
MSVESHRDSVVSATAKLAGVDFGKMREIARAIHEDPSLLAAFEKDPEAVAASINGFEVPEGFHIHIADAENTLIPAEDAGVFGADSRDSWDRLEVRAGYKTISLVVCA